jgi:hypothetical protein
MNTLMRPATFAPTPVPGVDSDLGGAMVVIGCLALLLVALVIAGMIVCAVRMKRPTANRKGFLSFIVFAVGWLLYAAAASLIQFAGLSRLWAVLAVGVFFLSSLSAIVLAILGLAEMRAHRERYREGKGPAITTLALGGLLLSALIAALGLGFVHGFKQAMERSASRTGAGGNAGAPAVFEELRFSVRPPHPWVRTDIGKLNPAATVGFLRAKPEVYFMIIAERLGEDSELTQETLVGVVKANIASGASDLKVLEEQPEVMSGAPGVRLVIHATVNNLPLTYRYWIHASPEVAYQLISWGHQRDHPKVMVESLKAIESFTLLTPTK